MNASGPYTLVERINRQYLFIYGVIFAAIMLYFRKKIIGLNVFLALGIASIVVWYIYEKNEVTLNLEERQMETKIQAITPHLKESKEYDDIIDFLFSIREFYEFNPKVYEELVDNLDNFFEIYNIINIGTEECDYYFTIAETKKQNAINAVHALIYESPPSVEINDKIVRAHKRLDSILLEYLNQLHDICEKDRMVRGWDVTRKIRDNGPKPANVYFEKILSYQFA